MTEKVLNSLIETKAQLISDTQIAAHYSNLEKKSQSEYADDAWKYATDARFLSRTMPQAYDQNDIGLPCL